MVSKFNGIWMDQGGHQATIEGGDGSVTLHFTNVPERPEPF